MHDIPLGWASVDEEGGSRVEILHRTTTNRREETAEDHPGSRLWTSPTEEGTGPGDQRERYPGNTTGQEEWWAGSSLWEDQDSKEYPRQRFVNKLFFHDDQFFENDRPKNYIHLDFRDSYDNAIFLDLL